MSEQSEGSERSKERNKQGQGDEKERGRKVDGKRLGEKITDLVNERKV